MKFKTGSNTTFSVHSDLGSDGYILSKITALSFAVSSSSSSSSTFAITSPSSDAAKLRKETANGDSIRPSFMNGGVKFCFICTSGEEKFILGDGDEEIGE